MREKILLAIFVVTFPLVAYVSTLPPERFRNEITEWGARDSIAYQEFDAYRQQFGVNEYVVLSWPDCDLQDPRVETVTAKIETELASLTSQVSNGQRAVWELQDAMKLSHDAAIQRLRNTFIGSDTNKTAIGFNLSEAGRKDRGKVVSGLHDILRSTGIDPDAAAFSGLGYNLYALDREGLESPFRMVPLIMLLALVLTIVFVRDFWLALFINALGSYTGCLAFNIVYLADVDMNAIIWPLPTLTMLLTVSASLHFLSYFRHVAEAGTEDSKTAGSQFPDSKLLAGSKGTAQERLELRREFARRSRVSAIKPILCCTLTTAIGLLSLLLSSSEPVRQFGIFGALSIIAANTLLLIWLPAFLTLIGMADRIRAQNVRRHQSKKFDGWRWLARFTESYRWGIIIGCLVFLVWCATGIMKIETGTNLQNFFPAGHRVLTDTTKVEASTGPLNSIELLLRFDQANQVNDPLRIRGINELCTRVINDTSIESCISAANFAPQLKRRPSSVQKTVQLTRISKLKRSMVDAGLLNISNDGRTEIWRISCRYSINASIDMNLIRKQLAEIVDSVFVREDTLVLDGENLRSKTTGEFVLFDHVDRQFFRELMVTYLTAFVAIMLVVVVVLRSFRACLIAILPNLFPAIVVLGIAGHLGFTLDVASLMTASVALGIAVDDTLHFLLWQKDSAQDSPSKTDGMNATKSVESTLRYCGNAIFQTSMILGTSIVLYALCGFLPTVRFGILLSAMMFAALVGDLLFLPALLRPARDPVAEA